MENLVHSFATRRNSEQWFGADKYLYFYTIPILRTSAVFKEKCITSGQVLSLTKDLLKLEVKQSGALLISTMWCHQYTVAIFIAMLCYDF